ncbi:MAG: AMP-binding protein [Deltaproteobacteria bacterium]|nr:AMP-binding protein [Deltaproteobacteria bacterium]
MTAREASATLAERVHAILAIDPDAPAIELEGRWHSWRDLSRVIDGLAEILTKADPDPHGPIGMLLRNTPPMVAAMLSAVVAERCIVTLNPHQGDAKVARDIVDVRTRVVLAAAEDWERASIRAAALETKAVGIVLTGDPLDPVRLAPGLERAGSGPHRAASRGVAVEMLTSGTTGPPKRIPLERAAFERTITAAKSHYATKGDADDAPRLAKGVAIVSSPFVHMSGLFRTLLNVCEGRKIALLPRFAVESWVDLVRRHRPRAVSLVPTAVRMVLEADVDPADLSSIQVVTSGTAKLDPQVQLAFELRYGIPVLPSYGATEFAGGVAGWTLALHREWGETKRGSVGRPQPGRDVRIVDGVSGDPLSEGETGRIEVRSAREGAWQRTTDLGRIDADGFLWIVGRDDDAILRGGFKILPSDVVQALIAHPAVRDACVVGLPDPRLGQIPVAAVELHDDAVVDGETLLRFAREHLATYAVPAEIRIVPALPRTPSLKVSQPEVRAIFVGDPS